MTTNNEGKYKVSYPLGFQADRFYYNPGEEAVVYFIIPIGDVSCTFCTDPSDVELKTDHENGKIRLSFIMPEHDVYIFFGSFPGGVVPPAEKGKSCGR